VQVLLALDKIWHIEHFLCAYCKRQLRTNIFYENGGLPYCELDYQELFLLKCDGCHSAIMEVSVCVSVYELHSTVFYVAVDSWLFSLRTH